MTIPYTYLIGWKTLNKWYYGVRYGKKCQPSELWQTYFTSSNHVREFRKNHGDPDVIEIRKTFDNTNQALLWEHKVLKRLNVIKDDKWLNKTDNKCFDPVLMSNIGKTKIGKLNNFYGRKHSIKSKQIISEKQKNMSEDRKKKISESIKRKHQSGDYDGIYTKERNEKLRKANKGQIPWNKGKKLSEDHKKKISESEKRTKKFLKGA